ncbi:MAG: peptidoglycan DD-metalloendopeptidase family protein [Patescibacteria group bacterium]
MQSKKVISIVIAIAVLIAAVLIWQALAKTDAPDDVGAVTQNETLAEPIKTDRIELVEIAEGSTYGILMAEAGIDANVYMDIYNAAEGVYDLASIRIGRFLQLRFDKDTDEFVELMYQIDTEEELFVRASTKEVARELESGEVSTSTDVVWEAQRETIVYDIEVVHETGVVETSMYEAAIDAGIDERAIIELANAFQWSVDFAMEVQKGDEFTFVYEKRYRDGEYVMPGNIFAGKFTNKGVPLYVFYFEESEDNTGFFDEEANSVQKMFLKAPVEFKYISSGFTTGLRYVEAFNVSTGHRAIDYAAALGTPIRAVGNGSVTFAGWDGPYGNKISIRHNGTYSTNYAHLSKFAIRSGQKVKQGDIIGYVGSTGFSTGPHLHYEMVKNGVKVNPLTEVLPPGKPIKDENKERFYEQINPLKEQLDS